MALKNLRASQSFNTRAQMALEILGPYTTVWNGI